MSNATDTARYAEARQALQAHLGPLACEPGESMNPTCHPGDILVMEAYGLPDSVVCTNGWERIPGADFIYNVLPRGGEYQWWPPILRATGAGTQVSSGG